MLQSHSEEVPIWFVLRQPVRVAEPYFSKHATGLLQDGRRVLKCGVCGSFVASGAANFVKRSNRIVPEHPFGGESSRLKRGADSCLRRRGCRTEQPPGASKTLMLFRRLSPAPIGLGAFGPFRFSVRHGPDF